MDSFPDIDTSMLVTIVGVGLIFLVVFSLAAAACLKCSISWIGDETPGLFACLGWLSVAGVVSSFISAIFVVGTSPQSAWIATPLAWLGSAWVFGMAGKCGVLRGFGILVVNSLLTGVTMFGLFMLMFIPLSMVDLGLGDFSDSDLNKLQAWIETQQGGEMSDETRMGPINQVRYNPAFGPPPQQDSEQEDAKAPAAKIPTAKAADDVFKSVDNELAGSIQPTKPIQDTESGTLQDGTMDAGGAKESVMMPRNMKDNAEGLPQRVQPKKSRGVSLNPFFNQ